MKTKIKTVGALALSLLLLLGALLLTELASDAKRGTFDKSSDISIATVSDDTDKTVIVSADKNDVKIFYSAATAPTQTLAKAIESLIYELYGVRVRALPDSAEKPSQNEILLGNTNRDESGELYSAVMSKANATGDFYWGYALINGKFTFVASEALAYEFATEELLSFLTTNDFTVANDLLVYGTKSRAEYEKELEEIEAAKRQERIEELIETNNKFTQEDFGGAFLEMPTNRYNNPEVYPTKNQHPRLFFTENDIPEIYDALFNNPELTYLKNQFWEYANAEDFTGIFPEKVGNKTGEIYRFDTQVLRRLEAKALAYLLTGDEIYGYEAIIGAKNVMLSLHYTTDLHSDVYHGASQTMVNVAKVFDWCYDLMSEDDRNQIIAGVSNVLAPQMESGMRFPPSGMNGISGHGTGPQFIRDWMTVAIAFYDEAPSWWQFVGGRFYQDYVPAIDYCYQGGFASQGTTTYGDSKYFTKGWAALIVKTATGDFPYVENFHLGAYYYFSHLQSNGKYFQTGDGGRTPTGCSVGSGVSAYFMSALLFQDPTIAAMAKKYSNDYTYFSYEFTQEATVPDVLIWVALGPEINEQPCENIDTILYLPFPSGTMTARESWNEDAAAVLMRMGEMTMANHDLLDHGTFQIYYKGLLAGTSGAYKKYGSNVHRYYLQATVAHNGLLVFNPAFADENPTWNCTTAHTHSLSTCPISNASRYFYSGSQYYRGEAGSYDNWISGKYNISDVFGADWSYDSEGAPKWAYIAGDLTNAYTSTTVKYVGRKMLTIFTGDEAYPMLFFTYDQIDTPAGSENYTKTFLLHTVKEPVIDTENLTAVVTEGEGRLFLHSLTGAQQISKVGGKGQAWWVNGKNCVDQYAPVDNGDQIWGRLELSATGSTSNNFLTAMYVADATNETPLDVKYLTGDSIDGAEIKDNFVIFTKSIANAQTNTAFSFTTSGKGLKTYYVAGLEEGTWQVSVDGITVANVHSDADSGIVSFIAPAGEVSFKPGNNVIGANGGRINYVTGGATLPSGTPYNYNSDVSVDLPATIERGSDTFLGWYTSESFDESTRVTKTPTGITGTFTVYAKFLSTLLEIDFSDNKINLASTEKNTSVNGVNYNANGKDGASFTTKVDDASGLRYLEWIEGSKDPLITHSNSTKNYASMTTNDECATFTVTLSKNGDAPMMTSHFRIYTKKTVSGGSATTRQYIFTTNSAGEVMLGVTEEDKTGPLVATLTDKPITLRFVMDFKNEEIRAYDEAGTLLASSKVAVKSASGAANMSEWRKLLDSIVFYWYGSSASDAPTSSMRIYNIKIEEGDRVAMSKT